jgi:hypothetical protein
LTVHCCSGSPTIRAATRFYNVSQELNNKRQASKELMDKAIGMKEGDVKSY